MKASRENYLKFFFGLVLCLFFRLIPFRAPNVEPILATTMPFSRVLGVFFGFSFAVLSILIYDIITHTLGIQTLFTAGVYGMIALWSYAYFKKNKEEKWSYVRFAVMGTLFFDAFTGLTVGPMFFHQSFLNSFIGQIPFTALHLVSNVVFAYTLSPAIYKFLIRKRKFLVSTNQKESESFINNLNPKII